MDGAWLDLLARWLHFIAGVIWVGHNYASVVQRPAWRPLVAGDLADADAPHLRSVINREHGTFRWASVVTWGAGVFMLWQRGWLHDAFMLQGGLAAIGIGAWIGTLMLLNLWFVLWPHQKKVLGLKPACIEERLRCARITHLSSRTNTMLSIPLLFFMAAGSHGAALFV